ncbi:MAG TPA: CBS domain-containing protein [Methylotenera sp.]|nr:CBS domain-containing protein [Methylotenera sp.]HPH05417.1 CBS domain-containing protein [Methylotenera sp.]HPN01516.1 CBS domain-containing protein [Methylotenera sp.]
MKTLQQLLDQKNYKNVISILPQQSVFDALVLMAEYKIGALVVLQGEQLAGIFSERDYAREVVLKGKTSKTTPISEVMTSQVFAVKPEDTVDYALSIITDKRIRHLPVIQNNKVVGMLSIGDLVKETIDYQQRLIQQLEQYIRS